MSVGVLIIAAMLPLFAGNYALTVGSEIAIFVIFAASLHFLMSVGGLASFGHAAYFGLGAYGVAFLAKAARPPWTPTSPRRGSAPRPVRRWCSGESCSTSCWRR